MLAAAAVVNGPTTEFPGTAALLPVLGAVLVIVAGARAPGHGAGALLSSAPLRYLGRISYAWYLWHWPCLVFARTARWAPPDGRIGVTATVLAIALSLALAVVTHALVERPARRMAWFAVPRRRALLLGSSVTVAAVLALGITGGPFVLPGGTLDVIGNASAAVPAATTPLDAQASTAYPALHGCHVGYGATAPASGCVFGDVAGRRTVVLVGDSHAAQWFPALERLAEREHFRLVSWTKSGCPFTLGVHIYLPALGRDYTECLEWQQHVLHDLSSQRPAMIIVGRTSTYLPQVLTPDGDQVSSSEAARIWGAGVAATVRALRPLAPRVVVLRDTPHAPFDIPACISWDPGETVRCNFRFGQSGQLDGAEYAAERAAGVPASLYADPARVVCPGAVCQAEVDGIIVYRDDNHITAAFAASRWRQFAEALGNEQRRRPI